MPLTLIRDDLSCQHADAVVLPANTQLIIDGGSALQVARIAGFGQLQDACAQHAPCKAGQAIVTPPFEYPAKAIIHAVGPIWGQGNEAALLESAYRQALQAAIDNNCESIALPLISTGVHGVPEELSLSIARKTIVDFLQDHELNVTLVLFSKESIAAASSLAAEVQEYIDDNYAFSSSKESRRRIFGDAEEDSHDFITAANAPTFTAPESYEPAAPCFAPAPSEQSMPCSAPAPQEPPMFYTCAVPHDAEFDGPNSAPKEAKAKRGGILPKLPKFRKKKAQADVSSLISSMDEPFSTALLRLVDAKGMTDAEVYKRANMSRQLFSKIRGDAHYRPTKKTVLALCVALRLSLLETNDLLGRAGFALSHASKFDLIVEYFILNEHYDVFDINEMLYLYDQPLLG